MNTKLFFIAIAIVATFSFAVTAITTNVSAQNMTDGNMTDGNMTDGNMTDGNMTGGNMTMSAGDNMTSMANNLTMEMDDKYSAGG